MRTIVTVSFKGGTAKTSTALHLGSALAKYHGKRVLLIDFDAQANLTSGLGFDPDKVKTLGDVFGGNATIKEVIKPVSDNLSLIGSNAFMDGIERTPKLSTNPYSHELLRRALREVSNDYDLCFIDVPPSLQWLTQAAAFAANLSLICAVPEAYSILALDRLKEFHKQIDQHHNLSVFGVVLSFWDGKGALNLPLLEKR